MPNAQYIQDIEKAIKDVRRVVNKSGDQFTGSGKEYQTRYWIIDPILRALGWNVSDPGLVWIEYPINGEIADYALFVPDLEDPIMLLEAKAIPSADIIKLANKNDNANETKEFKQSEVNQLRRQCTGLTEGYGVLSCGSLWSIFDLGIPGKPRTANGFLKKEIASFNILFTPLDECVEKLKLLHRRNV